MLASPEAARFVLVTQAHLFKPTYPKSKERLVGPAALFFHQGDYHTRLRKLVQTSLSIEAIRNLVPDIDALASSALDSWHGGRVVNTFHEMKKVCGSTSDNILIFPLYKQVRQIQRMILIHFRMICSFLLKLAYY